MTLATAWQRELAPDVAAQITRAIARCDRLPVMDRTVQRVLALTEDEEASTSELVAALEADPELAANMLRYANSGYAGRPIRAKTVRQAVTMVGRLATRQLCLGAVTFRFFESAPGNGRASRGQLHTHAVAVATVAAATARLVGIAEDLPHLAGLLHDCGKLVMPLAFGEEAMNEVALSYPSGGPRSDAERSRFGVDHAYAGALFAAHSGLHDELVAAIAWHHGGHGGCDVPTAEIACVQLANVLVSMLAGAEPDEPLLETSLEALGLEPGALDGLAETGSAPAVRPRRRR